MHSSPFEFVGFGAKVAEGQPSLPGLALVGSVGGAIGALGAGLLG